MTLYESGDSTGEVSLSALLQAKVKTGYVGKVELYKGKGLDIADLRGHN